MRIKQLPDNATEHEAGDFNAVTVPVEKGSIGPHDEPRTQDFDKIIVFNGPRGSWVHKDYRARPRKNRKRSKKKVDKSDN